VYPWLCELNEAVEIRCNWNEMWSLERTLRILPSFSALGTYSSNNFEWPFTCIESFHVHTLPHLTAMLDTFEILTTSGVVLWSRSYTAISPAIINGLITNVFIEERTLPGAGIADDISAAKNPPYRHDQHTLKWTTVKELGLIFVVRRQM
jgi:hypothetical protein